MNQGKGTKGAEEAKKASAGNFKGKSEGASNQIRSARDGANNLLNGYRSDQYQTADVNLTSNELGFRSTETHVAQPKEAREEASNQGCDSWPSKNETTSAHTLSHSPNGEGKGIDGAAGADPAHVKIPSRENSQDNGSSPYIADDNGVAAIDSNTTIEGVVEHHDEAAKGLTVDDFKLDNGSKLNDFKDSRIARSADMGDDAELMGKTSRTTANAVLRGARAVQEGKGRGGIAKAVALGALEQDDGAVGDAVRAGLIAHDLYRAVRGDKKVIEETAQPQVESAASGFQEKDSITPDAKDTSEFMSGGTDNQVGSEWMSSSCKESQVDGGYFTPSSERPSPADAFKGTSKRKGVQSAKGGRSVAVARVAEAALSSIGDDGSLMTSGTKSAGRAVIRGAVAARKGLGVKGVAKASAVAIIDDDDGAIGDSVRIARSAKEVANAAHYLNQKLGQRAVKRAGGSSASQMAAQLKRTYAQAKSMAIARGAQQGMTIQGMSLAQKAQATIKALSNVAVEGLKAAGGAIISAISSILGSLGAMIAPVALPVLLIMILVTLLVGVINGGDSGSTGSLAGTEREVAQFFKEKKLDDIRIAAILGNMYAESGVNPNSVETGGTGIGISQWSTDRADSLRSYAASVGKPWTDLRTQLDFFWDHDIYQKDWKSTYQIGHTTVSGSKAGFLAADSVETATKEFCFGWERPGIPALQKRIDAAIRYLGMLQSGNMGNIVGGEDYEAAKPSQKAVADRTAVQPFVGAGKCAAWVNRLFTALGNEPQGYLPYASSYQKWTPEAFNSDTVKVGMIIVVPSTVTSPGIGHIGIYIGGGKIISNETGGVIARPTSEWIRAFCKISPAYQGWINNVDLSK